MLWKRLRNIRYIIPFFIFTGVLVNRVSAQVDEFAGSAEKEEGTVPLATDLNFGLTLESSRQVALWQLEAAQAAMEAGMGEIGETLVSRALASGKLSEENILKAKLLLAWLSIIRGEVDRSETLIRELISTGFEVPSLLRAIVLYYKGELDQSLRILSSLKPEFLDPVERSWYYLVRGLVLSSSGETESANAAFTSAERIAPTATLRDHFEILRLREELSSGKVSPTTISALRESVRAMKGDRSGFEAARLLAIALNKSGEKAEAMELLNQQLSVPGLRESGMRPTFLILLGVIGGPGNPRGRLALSQLISERVDLDLQSVALTLLGSTAFTEDFRNPTLELLTGWLNATPPHPLSDRMLLYRALIRMENGQYGLAEEDAGDMIANYPSSEFIDEALRLLAYVSWKRNPPQYRTAADYLNRLRRRLNEGDELQRVGTLRADCFFLNGDYVSAAEAYGALFRNATAGDAGALLFQRVLSEIRARRLERVESIINEAYSDERVPIEAIWQTEWNYLDALKESGAMDQAVKRVSGILANPDDKVSNALIIRFEWLRARLELENGNYQAAYVRAADILESLDPNGRYKALPPDIRSGVESHALLIEGEAAYRSNQESKGKQAFDLLRQRYPGSGPAILSFLVEARAATGAESLVSAQQSLIQLADLFPGSEYAPIALWEAALNAEQRGLNQHLREAITILERVVTQYPNHPLVFFSRLKQGDIARRLNDFGTALLLYERLLSTYPDHPERWRAEMSRADCLAALGSQDANRLEDAAVAYERLTILPSQAGSVRLEAGYKWAQSVRLQNDEDGYRAVLWLLYDRFIANKATLEPISLSEDGRYWLARLILELGDVAERTGKILQARDLYETLISLNLPGQATAKNRLNVIPGP